MSETIKLALPDARALEIALDELLAYTGTVGEEDDRYEVLLWTIKRLRSLLKRGGYAIPKELA